MASCVGDDGASIDELLKTTDQLLVDVNADQVETPTVTESKSIQYVTATARVAGETGAVTEQLVAELSGVGWEIVSVERLDVSAAPADEGYQIIAERDGQVARLALFDQIGTRVRTPGQFWVQVSVANPDSRLSWTQT